MWESMEVREREGQGGQLPPSHRRSRGRLVLNELWKGALVWKRCDDDQNNKQMLFIVDDKIYSFDLIPSRAHLMNDVCGSGVGHVKRQWRHSRKQLKILDVIFRR